MTHFVVSEELANMDRVNRDFYLASVGMPKVEKKTNLSLKLIKDIIYDVGNYDKLLTNSQAIKTEILYEQDESIIAHQLIKVDIPFPLQYDS